VKEQSASEPRILKIVTCPSLSGRASLTYHVGCTDKGEVCFRIWNTASKGVFSKEWVSATDIRKVLAQHESVAALMLLPVFQVGRSVNTAGFLLAALKNEGLVSLSPTAAHRYLPVESKSFAEEVSALIKAGTSLDASADAPVAVKESARRKKPRGPAAAAPWDVEAKAGDQS
jgi:hypothetical protein